MATIQTSIRIYDGMTPALRGMTNAVNAVLSGFEAIQNASHNIIDTSSIVSARAELNKAEMAINDIERAINSSAEAQQNLNDKFSEGAKVSSGLGGKIKQFAAAYGGIKAVQGVLNTSDQLSQTTARLNLMNDGKQSTSELQNMIFQSSQNSRSDYMDTAAFVSQLGIRSGDAFKDNKETVAFANQLNKQFVIAGASQDEVRSATLQLTQALGSGVLRGEEFNAVFEAAPNIMQTVADYMDVPIGSLREMAAKGQISADIVKNAMLSAADETNARFESMPMTFGQVWTTIKNSAIQAFQPVLQEIGKLTSSSDFQKVIQGVTSAIAVAATVAGALFGIVVAIGSFVVDNWSWISPIVWGVVAALIAYNAMLLVHKGLQIASCIASYARAAATGAEVSTTAAATAAQYGLNTALLACPITWIIIAIIALIAIFYAAIAAVNHFAGTSLSATGIICGAFMVVLAVVGNIFIALWNLIVNVFVLVYNLLADVGNFLGNVFVDPVGAVCRLFFDLADTVLGIIETLASAIDTVFGTKLSDSVRGWRDSLGGWVDSKFGKGNEIFEKLNADDLKLGRFEYKSAYQSGYQFGEGIDNKVSGFFDKNKKDPGDDNFKDLLDGVYNNDNLNNIAKDTSAISDSMDIAEEDLQYMRDLAEQEAINRFTTADLRVEFTANNSINSNLDIDGVCDYMANRTAEQLALVAEGVH